MKAGPGDVQCEAANVCSLLLVLFLHGAGLVLPRSRIRSRNLSKVLLICALVNVVALREIVILTLMHQIMGMMAAEAAVRLLSRPLLAPTTWGDGLSLLVLFVPNLGVTLGETLVAVRVDPSFALGIGPVFFDLGHFGSVPFYKKQHAILHAVLCVLIISLSTPLVPRWRRVPAVQRARAIVEPACLVGVALILFTHRHGIEAPELASHPVIGALMCIAGLLQLICCLAHLAVPTRDGALPDLTEPPSAWGVDSLALQLSRCVVSYVFLVLANFLFVDTYMEYLGCRQTILYGSSGQSLGLTSATEMSTYITLAVMGGALSLSCLVAAGDGALSPSKTDTELRGLRYSRVAVEEALVPNGSMANGAFHTAAVPGEFSSGGP